MHKMPTVDLVYFDAGGGHRSSATALSEVIHRQGYPWEVRLVNLQEILDPIDIIRRITKVRIQNVYNSMLKNGWTLGSAQLLKVLQAVIYLYHHDEVKLLKKHWTTDSPDMVVSLVPHFNRALKESLDESGTPFVTVMTDLADYPPHFWIEPQRQYFVCGSAHAVQQALSTGVDERFIQRSSGMIVSPKFYDVPQVDVPAKREQLGLRADLPTALVLFGGQGSKAMLEIARRVESSTLKLQFIYLCGHNAELAEKLRAIPSRLPKYVQGFTKDVPYYMALSNFFIGKPGPGSISEALLMKLPVIVELNAWTLPQERYNCEWIRENEVGIVVRSFAEVVPAIQKILEPETNLKFRSNAAELENRAVFEIPAMLDGILKHSRGNDPVSGKPGCSSSRAVGGTPSFQPS
jgi:hypothetical protein